MIILLIIIILGFLFYASYSIKSQIYVRTLCRVRTAENIVYLTFDDAPDAVQTPKVLDVLKQNNIKATFFCIGSKIVGNEQIIKQIIVDGHQIGNHSFRHKNTFPLFSRKKMLADVELCQQTLKNIIGCEPTFFRPPFGVTNPHVAWVVKKTGLKVIGWTIRSYDTNAVNQQKIIDRIVRQLKSGAIILLHDRLNGSETLLQSLIDEIRGKGFSFGELKV